MSSRSSLLTQEPEAGVKMTWEEFLVWAPDSRIAEWVDGEAYIMAPPSVRHQVVLAFLADVLRWFVRTKKLGQVLFAPLQMKLARSGREPDILFISKESQHRLRNLYLEGPADLVVEVISPDGRARDRREKFREYEEAGVREYWLIDPARKQADFYYLDSNGKFELIPIDAVGSIHSVVLAGLWLKVDWLWQDQLPDLEMVIEALLVS